MLLFLKICQNFLIGNFHNKIIPVYAKMYHNIGFEEKKPSVFAEN
jgi:hypothetical protein